MSYRNVNDFIVIEEDDRDPDVSWQHHLERGSLGGVDCVAPMRTPVYAPVDGDVTGAWMGTGGLTARLEQDDGWRDEFMHMDQVVSGPVRQGELIGYSGASGGNYAPHVHWHRVDPQGARRNPWHYFTSAPAGGDHEPIEQEDEDDMDIIYIHSSGGGTKYAFSRSKGKVVRAVPSDEWAFLRAIEKTAGGIPIPLVLVSDGWLAKALELGKAG